MLILLLQFLVVPHNLLISTILILTVTTLDASSTKLSVNQDHESRNNISKYFDLPTITISYATPEHQGQQDNSNRAFKHRRVLSQQQQDTTESITIPTPKLIEFINGKEIIHEDGKATNKDKNSTNKNYWIFTGSKTVLSASGKTLQLNCIAPFMTRWISNIQFRRLNFPPNKLKINEENDIPVNLTTSVEFSPDFGSSGYIACVSLLDLTLVSTLYIFTGDNESFPLVRGDEYAVVPEPKIESRMFTSSFVVPCRTNYPVDYHPEILQNIAGSFISVEPEQIQSFEPTIGFTLKSFSIPINLTTTQPRNPPSAYKCKLGMASKEIPVVITKGEMIADLTTSSTSLLSSRIVNSLLEIDIRKDEGLNKLVCTLDNSSSANFLKNVSLNRTVRIIKCDQPYQCHLRKTEAFSSKKKDSSIAQVCSDENDACALGLTFSKGIALCSLGPVTAMEYFFSGLDNRKFKFVLRSTVQFYLRFKNGTVREINEIEDSRSSSHNDHSDSEIGRQEISILLSKDVSEVGCKAVWYNSTRNRNWALSSRKVDVRDPAKPAIERISITKMNIFTNGDLNRNLICTSSGEPMPQISWTVKNLEDNKRLEASRINYQNGILGKSVLDFLYVDYSAQGAYTCLASNAHGNDTFEFQVEVKGPLGWEEILTIVAVAGTILLLCTLATVLGVKYYEAKRKIRHLTEEEIETFISGTRSCLASRGNTYVTCNSQTKSKDISGSEKALELPFKHAIADKDLYVDRNKVLGKGEYGLVYSGLLLGEAVAIKTTKPSTEIAHVKALLDEIKIMAYIGDHPHIVTFLGAEIAKIHEKKIHVVVELSNLGNLHGYLRKFSHEFIDLVNPKDGAVSPSQIELDDNFSTLTMLDWSAQIADGMNFLQEKKVIHADLATRNVLMFSNNILKITDFGLSRQLYGYSTYTKKQKSPLPWRWMALESLRFMEFSSQSDVWAFGMTVWEIFSLAQLPYSAYTWDLDFMEKIDKGMRVGQPIMATPAVYDIMLKCWNNNPNSRPTFLELKDFFQNHRTAIGDQLLTNCKDTSESRAQIRAKKTVSFEILDVGAEKA